MENTNRGASSGGADAAPINYLGIDVRTKDARKLMARLKRLKSTDEVSHGGVYHADPTYAMVRVTTTKTEDELDAWLYAGKGIDYVGVFDLKAPLNMRQ